MRNLADNLLTLLAALIIATVIWVIAIRIDDPIETRTYVIPVMTANLPASRILVENTVESVQITVDGPTSLMTDVAANDFVAIADLSEIVADISNIEIQIQFVNDVIDPEELSISVPIPTQTQVTVDRLITRDISVQLIVAGSASAGYAIGQGTTDPATIQLTGPSQRVNAIAEARVTVVLDNARESFNAPRRPIFYDQSGNVASVSGLTPSAEQVQAIVPIEQLDGVQAVPIVVNWTGLPAAGYRLTNLTVSPDFVQVSGTPEQINNLGAIQTQTIDITGLTESFTQQVALDLPDGIELVEVTPFVVTAEIEPLLSTEILRVEPVIRGLADTLTVTLDVETVRLTLFGPLPIVDTLTEQDIRVTLDLFGLEPGTHEVVPAVDIFAEEIEVRSILPAMVTVFITDVVTSTANITATLPLTATTPTTNTLLLVPGTVALSSGAGPSPPLFAALPPRRVALAERWWLF